MLVLIMSLWIWSSPHRNLTWSLLGDEVRSGSRLSIETLVGVTQKVSGRFSLMTC